MDTAFDVDIKISMGDGKSYEAIALLDSGCTSSSIDKRFVKLHQLYTRKLPRPIPVYNVDGTHNSTGAIQEFILAKMKVTDHEEMMALAVTNLGTHPIYLGHDWLNIHNPDEDWKMKTLRFRCKEDHLLPLKTVDNDNDEEIFCSKEHHLDGYSSRNCSKER